MDTDNIVGNDHGSKGRAGWRRGKGGNSENCNRIAIKYLIKNKTKQN